MKEIGDIHQSREFGQSHRGVFRQILERRWEYSKTGQSSTFHQLFLTKNCHLLRNN